MRSTLFQVFKKLQELELRGHPIGERSCSLIARMEGLRVLNLHACGIGDQGLKELSNLRLLERLDVGYSNGRITDTGATHLSKMVKLQYLNIYDSSISDKSLGETLALLKDLRSVELTKSRVSDQGIQALKTTNPNCQVLNYR